MRARAAVSLALGALAWASSTLAAPIRPRVASCRPLDYLDWDDVPKNGSGNVPLRRSIALHYDLFTHAEDDAKPRGDVVADTHRIEVCLARGGVIKCPGHGTTDEPWVLYDDSVTPPVLRLSTYPPVTTPAELAERLLPSTGSGARFGTELLPVDPRNDWDDPSTAGSFYVLRVNSEPLGPSLTDAGNFAPAFVVEGGFCALPRRLARSGDGHYLAYGVEHRPLWPFPGPMPLLCRDPRNPASCVAQDPCVDGAKAIGPGGAPYHAHSHCVNPLHARFLVDRASEFDVWQREIGVARAAPSPPAWVNGADGGACSSPVEGHCPSRIFLSPIEAGGQGTHGGVALNTSIFPPTALAPLSSEAGAVVSLTIHELSHKLQDAYLRQSVVERGVDPPGFHAVGVSEAVPTALQAHVCLDGYGGVTTRKCVSPGMLGQQGSAAHLWLDAPSADILDLPYTTAVAWRYAMEQFALPIAPGPASGHPSGKASLLQADRSLPLGHPSRRADEGADLLGPLLQAIATHPDEPPFEGAFRGVLVEHLGRDLENVLLDLHTTLLLKDYRDVDPRWSIDWIGDMNAGAQAPLVPGWGPPAAPMHERKPFPVPPDLRAAGPDQLPRARRELDSHEACTGPRARCKVAPPRPLPPDGGFASGAPALVHGHGAAYLSAIPAPGSAGLTLRVSPSGDAPLRLRVFTVDRAGTPSLLPSCREAVSGPLPAPQQQCRPGPAGDYVVDVPVTPEVAEVLAVVSNTKPSDALFGWRVGRAKASLSLLEPTRAVATDVGHPSTGRRPFRVALSARDEQNEPARLRTSAVELRVPGCAAGGECVVPRDAYRAVEVSRGTLWLVGTLPAELYPPPGATLSVEVRATTRAGEALRASSEAALVARAAAPKRVTMLVLDRSGSMDDGDGAKLAATKVAARAVLDGLRDGDELGLVTFNHDAQTISPVRVVDAASRPELARALDGVRALGWTSVGDGALEAASALVEAGYDEQKGSDPALAMLVVSDGRSNSGYEIERYTLHPPYAGYSDGTSLPDGAFDLEDLGPDNLPWTTGTSGMLGWTQRAQFRSAGGATYLVPRVSTVAVGQDADAGPLRKMADVCRGVFSYADGLTLTAELPAAVAQIGEAVLGGVAAASGRERVFSRVAPSLAEVALPALPPGTRDVTVTVLAGAGGLEDLTLEDARGRRWAASERDPRRAIFRVEGALAGALRLVGHASTKGPVLVDVTARAPGAMFVHVDVDGVPAPPTDGRSPFEAARHAGAPVRVVAALVDDGPVLGAELAAVVRTPGGEARRLSLLDDGAHGDGAAGDGVYAATIVDTAAPGVYRVEIDAQGGAERTFSRSARVAVALDPPPDRDRDGLPDAWERAHGTDASRDDAREDPDGDGLDNATERRLGTLPLRGDSDGGGESDASELAAGRSPTDAADDRAVALPVRVVAGADHVAVGAPVRAREGLSLEVRVAASASGRFVTAACAPRRASDGSLAVRCPARAGTLVCASARTTDACRGSTSAWSSPRCARVGRDADLPRVDGIAVRSARGRDVRLVIDASDAPHGKDPLRDTSTRPSGLEALRVDVGGQRGSWRPVRREVSVRLPAAEAPVTVVVRDRAGNVSSPVTQLVRAQR
ncbi:MAG: VWA domain-containing protein [Polyangiaceae bacterium]|nr:VWA domain-containing protein [Polyangiaceae bacterium]